MSPPLLSVIIPTYNRPQYLPRAIASALEAAPNGDVEVIVVPNGPDASWQRAKEQFKEDDRVKWHPTEIGQVSRARNLGLSVSTGALIRFLDDDDYLYKEGSQKQCISMMKSNADICSGALTVVNNEGTHIKTIDLQATPDIVAFMLSPKRKSYTTIHVFRKSALGEQRWNEDLSLNEDMDWMINLASSKELNWIPIDEPVAAWVQHRSLRLSQGRDPGQQTLRSSTEMLLNAARSLEKSGRLAEPRKAALADGLWSLLQKGLRYDPTYWRNIASIANAYAPNRTPPSRIYGYAFIRRLDPLVIETLLIPIRWAYHPVRRALESFGINRV